MRRQLSNWEANDTFPDVTFIILNYRRPDDTIRCGESLVSINYQGIIKAIVVENGSGDNSVEIISKAQRNLKIDSRLIRNSENLGFTGGVLSAWPSADTSLICFLNNDAVVHPDLLTILVEHFRGRSDLGAVWPYDAPAAWRQTGRELSPAEIADSRNGTHGLLGQNIWLPILRTPHECFTGSGVCFLMERGLVEEPFPSEYFAYYEDVYLGWLLNLKGLRVERVPTATIYHEGSVTIASNIRLRPLIAFHAEKNRLANLLIFYSPSTLIRVTPLLLADEFKKFLVLIGKLINRQQPLPYFVCNFKARIWLLSNCTWLLAKRRAVQRQRSLSDEDLLPLISGRFVSGTDKLSNVLNWLSLAYCRIAGLNVLELNG